MTASASIGKEGVPRGKALRVTAHVVRWVMGLGFLLFGLNGFFNFLPMPAPALSDRAMAFFTGLSQSGYMFGLIFGTQVVVGALLVANRFVPLALLLIAPFIVNSMAFHLFLEHSGIPMASVFAAMEIFLMGCYWSYFRGAVTMCTRPGG